jgi:hypothetical protein
LCHYAGLTVPEAARRLGHSPALHISTYAHVIDGLQGRRFDGFDALISSARTELESSGVLFRQRSEGGSGSDRNGR